MPRAIRPVILLSWLVLVFVADRVRGQGLSPADSIKQMKMADGMEVRLVAAEPLVRQPVAIDFDDRGRLWVIQYLQYPNPEGLRRVQVDRYSRTKYDRVPEPPPRGPRGADRITILEDSDGDGVMDRSRDFVDGLNLTTGLAFGHGGVFVLNVPYLLFYPDRNRDDVPDSDPEVLLEGFGMEDAHSVANSLTWGPDGWLYGCQGSTVTANIRGVEFQQGVWRYHPLTREFELFCEGGGNAWGLDFDSEGRLFYSTNFGGFTLVHGVQGAYYVKSFGKHGALHNPHAYGYFEHAPHERFRGGHVTVGGIVYQGDAFPDSFRGRYVAGDLLGHGVYWHSIEPRGSTVKTAHGGELLVAQDTWFAPTDVTLGPDGAIYVADWHDARTAHPDPDADWDRSNGRIYRIAPRGTAAAPKFDLAETSVAELNALLSHRSQWYVRHARQELARRSHDSASPDRMEIEAYRGKWKERAESNKAGTPSLEALWALAQTGDLDESTATRLLKSPHAAVRAWVVRLLGDRRTLSDELAHTLDALAETEPSIDVRQQLACSAARFAPQHALPIINANINRDLEEDRKDPYLPLLWWWAVEKHSIAGREEVMKRFLRPTLWKSQLGRDILLPRLVRRYAAEQTSMSTFAAYRLITSAPDEAAKQPLWKAVLAGWQEQSKVNQDEELPTPVRLSLLARHVLQSWMASPKDLVLHELAYRLRYEEPRSAARREVFDRNADVARRVALWNLLRTFPDPTIQAPALEDFASDLPLAVRVAVLQWLAAYDSPDTAERLIDWYVATPVGPLHSSVRDVLLSRRTWAKAWVAAVDGQRIPASSTSLEQIRRVALFEDEELNQLVTKHWGRLQGASREEKLAEVRRLNNDLRAATGDATAGKRLFEKHCANCHQLFGAGAKIGPDLTTANRQDRDFLLVSLVDPSSVIRKEYVSVVVETKAGRVLTGLPIERNEERITLVDSKAERQSIPTGDIAELRDSPLSLMPDNLYLQFKPHELRDLLAYLQSMRTSP